MRENAPQFPGYIAPEGRAATLAVYIQVDPEPTVRPGDLEELLGEIARRVDKALDGIFGQLPAEVQVDPPLGINKRHVPFFPATFGSRVCDDQTDVFMAIEGLRKGTPLKGLLYDCSGRAFEVHVYATFLRVAQFDPKATGDSALSHEW